MKALLVALIVISSIHFCASADEFKIDDLVEVHVSAANELTLSFVTSEAEPEFYLITHDVSRKAAWQFEPSREIEVFPFPVTNLLSSTWGNIRPLRSGWTENGRFLGLKLVRKLDVDNAHSAFKSFTQVEFAIKGETVNRTSAGENIARVIVRFKLSDLLQLAQGKPVGVRPNIILLYPGLREKSPGLTEVPLSLNRLNEMAAGALCELFIVR